MAKDKTSVADIIAEVTKKSGLKVGTLNDVVEKVEGISTGNVALDFITGVGGFPVGRIVELYGPSASGKTSSAIQAAAAVQNRIISEGTDEYILYMDFEHAIDRDYCKSLGLDTDHESFLMAQPDYLEEGADLALKLIETGKVRYVMWDSVAAMVTKDETEGDFAQRTAAMNRARVLKALCNRLKSTLHVHNCTSVFINHMQVTVPTKYGEMAKEITPGGEALTYFASIRVKFRQLSVIKETVKDSLTKKDIDQEVAVFTSAKVTKNKVGPPLREAKLRINYGEGFDNTWQSLQILSAYGLIMKKSATHIFDEKRVPTLQHPDLPLSAANGNRSALVGEGKVLKFAKEHPEWGQELQRLASEFVKTLGDEDNLRQQTDDDENILLLTNEDE